MEFIQTIALSYKPLWVALHLFAMVLGLGGATYSDILLMKFLKDFKISKKEAEVIKTMSMVVFIGVYLALFSGILLFMTNPETYLQTPKFMAKVIAFSILFINGTLLHSIVLPKLIHFSFHKDHYIIPRKIHLRKLGFIMGAISATSWYMVFLMGAFPKNPFSFEVLIGAYFGIMTIAIIGALAMEKLIGMLAKKPRHL